MQPSGPDAEPLWQRRTSPSLGQASASLTLVVPGGSTEQHGPHLPVGVDAMVCEHVARAAAARADRQDRPVLVAPTIAYGSSHHHLPRPGTLSLSSDTMLAVLRDVLASAAATGVRRMVIVNGHGGNEDVARQAAKDVALQYPVVAAALSYWSIAGDALADIAVSCGVTRVPGHAGAFETSLVMAVAPDTVDAAAVPRDSEPRAGAGADDELADVAGVSVARHRWVHAHDGYTDGAAAASDALGAKLVDAAVEALAAFLARFAAQPAPEAAAR
jgi:creatinine amidohydrolase